MSGKILVAPLNWGLGHAARCIPIINALLKENFTPILASDGQALELLKREFPKLESLELPSYKIKYSKILWLGLLLKTPAILKTVKKEKQVIARYIKNHRLDGIISDNRIGLRHTSIPSVYISHQINVLFWPFSPIASWIHQKFIKRFDECWVPDHSRGLSLSGKLSENKKLKIKRIGALSRFTKEQLTKKYDITILISGPEPYRAQLEELMISKFAFSSKKICLVRGVIDKTVLKSPSKNIYIKNFLLSKQLQDVLNQSELIICRSGYSSILDLAKLQKKAFFIPTPGQFEQEYLAKRIEKLKIAPYVEQEKFEIDHLERVDDFNGFLKGSDREFDSNLFELFKGK